MPKTTGAKFVADTLKGYGLSHVFFVPQMLLDTLTGMEGMGIRRVMTHGEKAAAYMADGYARASGKPGVCMAQHVGASNLAAGLRDAYLACSPVIALTGGPAQARYRHAYQELEDFTQFDHTTKFNARVVTSPACRTCCGRRFARRPPARPARCTCSSAATMRKTS